MLELPQFFLGIVQQRATPVEINLTYVFLRCIHAEASFSGSFEKIQELKKAIKELKKWEGHLEELAVWGKARPIPPIKESDSLIGGTG